MGYAGAEPEIDHFDPLFRLIQQNVLQLDVTMGHIALMAVMNGLNDLAPEEFGLKLWHLPIGLHFEISVQTASIDELHDQKNLLVRLKCLVQLCDVRMIQLFHNFHLAFDAFPAIRFH